ncbi:PD-(D/E)XK nuclease-like domain-containing protein [Flavobacterium sp. AJR]|uniref:PD-(D/E)XK nuclease-like domain-containing protein n=1 Tax=Flavobacterium sp. AJR TaxID=1979369 RepID=UPI000A3D67E2|nr:PD-(D/E)XK nuclease-like domain-containing protein [Flavobacterium sp. AJR]OUL59989.1 hypothetical protein B8T70_22730 [Flavobacterium sp. AJR]
MSNLHPTIATDKEVRNNTIDFTRPLNEYPTAQFIAEFIQSEAKPKHIYTEILNVNGLVIQDGKEKYLSSDALSSSMLKAALRTPLHFKFAKSEDKEELKKLKENADHFNLSTFLHQAILEPTKFSRVIIEPNIPLNTNEGVTKAVEFWEQLITERGYGVIERQETPFDIVLEHCHKTVVETLGLSLDKIDGKRAYIRTLKNCSDVEPVSEENMVKIKILKKHYDQYGNGILRRLILHSKRETSVYYTDTNTGLKLKVRPDAIQFKENIGVDAIISVKSSSIEDLQAFYHQAARLHYDLSEGMCQEVVSEVTGRDFNTTIMVMLQTVAPFAIAILVWSAEDIETGKYKYHLALNNAKEIIEKQLVKGYEVLSQENNFGLIQMSLPIWNQQQFLSRNI